jgi:threonine dehydrogenase-like Zn-dependent dehydrogenase
VAERLGATHLVASREPEEIRQRVGEATGGEGAHVVVDTISGPESMRAAHASVRPGGTIACLGMDHFMGKVPELDWRDQYLRNLRITGGLLPGPRYLPELIDLRVRGRLEPSPLLTHRFPLEEAPRGYAMMAAREPGVVKVALTLA